MKYKVGDKVRVRKDLRANEVYGRLATVRAMMSLCGKEVTISRVLYSGYELLEDGSFVKYTWTDEMLEPFCTEKIVITSDGITTTARKYDGKKLVKEAKAVCSKDDTFNFDVGAKLAMKRLMAEDKPKYYNGKVVCITSSNNNGFTKGKIYQFTEGFTLDDEGRKRPGTGIPIKTFKGLGGALYPQWVEVAE